MSIMKPLLLESFMEIVKEVLESDELYDVLPGDGEDDYIIDKLYELFRKTAKEKLGA